MARGQRDGQRRQSNTQDVLDLIEPVHADNVLTDLGVHDARGQRRMTPGVELRTLAGESVWAEELDVAKHRSQQSACPCEGYKKIRK